MSDDDIDMVHVHTHIVIPPVTTQYCSLLLLLRLIERILYKIEAFGTYFVLVVQACIR